MATWTVQATKQHLNNHNIRYHLHQLSPFNNILETQDQLGKGGYVKTVLLHDSYGLIMFILPAGHALQLDLVQKILKRQLIPLSNEQHTHLLRGIRPHYTPPMGDAYGIKTIIDDELLINKKLYFCAGDNSHIIEVDIQNFHLLQQNATFMHNISIPTKPPMEKPQDKQTQPDQVEAMNSAKEILKGIERLPAMPDMARKLLILKNNTYAHVNDLAKIVEMDPSLTLQTIHYANSPIYGYGRKITDLNQAIQLLGFDMVLHVTMGIAVSKTFKLPKGGPFDLQSYWQHTIMSANLAQALSKQLPKEMHTPLGTTYLTGLLHNFGALLLGHLFPEKFITLGEMAKASPDTPLQNLEHELFGFDHGQLGALLLEQWAMADELIITSREQSNRHYHGSHATLVRLNQLSDFLLCDYNLINNCDRSEDYWQQLLNSLQLTSEQVHETAQKVLKEGSSLSALALQLAA